MPKPPGRACQEGGLHPSPPLGFSAITQHFEKSEGCGLLIKNIFSGHIEQKCTYMKYYSFLYTHILVSLALI